MPKVKPLNTAVVSEQTTSASLFNDLDIQTLAVKARGKTERYVPTDTFFIFMKTDILYFDHQKKSWDFGDTTGFDIN